MMRVLLKFIIFGLGFFLNTACIKEEIAVPVNPDDNSFVSQENISQSIRDIAFAEAVFTDALVTAMDVSSALINEIQDPNITSFSTNYGDCNASVNLSKSGGQSTIEITFANNDNCLEGLTGWNKSGTLRFNFSQNYFEVSSVVTLSFDNYTIDDISVSGQHIAENISINSDTLIQDIEVQDGLLQFADESSIEYNSNKTSLWVEGLTFTSLSDDVFLIESGSYTGSNRLANNFVASVINDNVSPPLKIKLLCWESGFLRPSQGVIVLSSLGENAAALYGDEGEGCNNQIDVNISYSFDN